MKILYFAWLRAQLGMAEETISLPEDVNNLHDLIDWLRARSDVFYAAFSDMDVIRIAVDQEYVTENVPLKGVREIAFFPPVTGG
ncbi:molybdopterin converting factor subunit 1 [Alphaproteobacteria bacterium 46_93_T64]|nr:molybdopterin converting factor subunit 1 [Alphaproteobacteria bacterium 46_93_T64]